MSEDRLLTGVMLGVAISVLADGFYALGRMLGLVAG